MSFIWREYIVFAENIINSIVSEASFRSCISRAYYGAFCTARNFCLNKKYVSHSDSKVPDIHRKIIEILKNSYVLEEYSLGNILHELRVERNSADYDGHYTVTVQKANSILEKAKRAVIIVDELNS